MRAESFIFYKSFYDAIKSLPRKAQLEAYQTIMEYVFEDDQKEHDGIAQVVFTMAKPQIDANLRRKQVGKINGQKGAEYGKLGGRPKKKDKEVAETDEEENGVRGFEETPNETPNITPIPLKKNPLMENVNVNANDEGKYIEKDIKREKYIEKDINSEKYIKKDIEKEDDVVFALPLNDGSLYGITESQLNDWTKLYPSVDIKSELNEMKNWCNRYPSRRKTKSGINRFITRWLSKAQDEGKPAYKKTTQVSDRNEYLLGLIGGTDG